MLSLVYILRVLRTIAAMLVVVNKKFLSASSVYFIDMAASKAIFI